ncbi:hypothetical protein NDU88_006645 [Pleurodeles waltl]|uniref:Uncharacterized protein n=1 Tax=Pleurodeles waltl TaxID=8319 RepID=A0AAV7M0Q5_PLEWA|nr:hypothetical protein NDU88_006645 [Pleurodeles waltl]
MHYTWRGPTPTVKKTERGRKDGLRQAPRSGKRTAPPPQPKRRRSGPPWHDNESIKNLTCHTNSTSHKLIVVGASGGVLCSLALPGALGLLRSLGAIFDLGGRRGEGRRRSSEEARRGRRGADAERRRLSRQRGVQDQKLWASE